ncbi:MAG: acetylxylan esterase [Victivallaceae bacterium]
MMQQYYDKKVEAAVARRQQRLDAVQTREQALQYIVEVKQKLSKCFGAFPEKTPLNARITGTIELENIRLEKVIFESRPGFPVTGILYLPKNISGKLPAVLGVCGHSDNGKASAAYQSFCQSLALKNFVVFMFDPISQGERVQYLDIDSSQGVRGCCQEHNMMGKQLQLCGEFFGDWRAWDGIRALDYLLSRPEVDSSRVGITGNSGGGTLTTYLNFLDDRPTMAAPGCFITTYQRNYQNELPTDAEQIPPGILAQGCEMADFIIARAPRPMVILGQKNDFFDVRGAQKAYEDAHRIYSLLGAEENIKLSIGPDNHGYSLVNRQTMYSFFTGHAGIAVDAIEPEATKPLSDQELMCTPEGQVCRLAGTRKVVDFIQDKAERLRTERVAPSADSLKQWLNARLNIPEFSRVPEYRTLRGRVFTGENNPDKLNVVNRFAIATEPGIDSCLKFIADSAWFHIPVEEKAVLYVSHLCALSELKSGLQELNADCRIFGLDVRGVGESQPTTCGNYEDYFAPYDFDYFYATTGIMLEDLYLGGKVRDVLAAVALLKAKGYKHIQLAGKGIGSLVAAFAAVICPDINQIRLLNAPISYQHSMIAKGITRWPLSHMIPDSLKTFDLPDVYRILAERDFGIINPWNNTFIPLSAEQIKAEAAICGLPESMFKLIPTE